jgi:DNA-directed RNA polymerase alpha subunit
MAELQTRQQIAATNAQLRMQELAMQREIEMLKMANEQNLTLEQIKAKLADTAMRERSRKELFAAEQRLKLVAGSGI